MAEMAATSPSQPSNSVLGLTFDHPPSDVGPVISGTDAAEQPSAGPVEVDGEASTVDAKAEAAEEKPAVVADEENDSKAEGEADGSGPVVKPEETAAEEEAKSPTETVDGDPAQSPKEKKKRNPGYINPERVKTGGVRDKPSADELTERMERIRLQNAKILAKREQADKDVQAYEESTAKEREAAREAARRRRDLQNQINNQRQANAERKLGNRAGREWDAEKATPSPDSGRGRGYGPGFRGGYDRGEFDRGGGDRGGYIPRGPGRVLRGGFRGAPRGGFRGRGGPPGGPTSPSTSGPSGGSAVSAAPEPTPAEAAALSKS